MPSAGLTEREQPPRRMAGPVAQWIERGLREESVDYFYQDSMMERVRQEGLTDQEGDGILSIV